MIKTRYGIKFLFYGPLKPFFQAPLTRFTSDCSWDTRIIQNWNQPRWFSTNDQSNKSTDSSSLKSTPTTDLDALVGVLESQNSKEALCVFCDAAERGVSVPAELWSQVALALVEEKNIEDCLTLMERLASEDGNAAFAHVKLELLAALLDTPQPQCFEQAEKLRCDLISQGVAIPEWIDQNFARECCTHGKLEFAETIFQRVKTPSASTLGAFARAYALKGKFDLAWNCLEQARRERWRIGRELLADTMAAGFEAGNSKFAFDVLARFMEDHRPTTSQEWRTLFRRLLRYSVADALDCLDRSKAEGQHLIGVITAGITTLCAEKRWSAVEAFFSEVTKRHGHILFVYNSYSNALCKQGRVSDAVAFIDSYPTFGLTPDLASFGAVVHHCARSHDTLPQAISTFEKMVAAGVAPDGSLHFAMARVYALCGQYEKSVDMAAKFPKNEASRIMGAVVKNILEAKGGPPAVEFLQAAWQRNLSPNFLWNIVLSFMVNAKDMGQALPFFQGMIGKGRLVDAVTYNIVLKGLFFVSKKPTDALELFNQMKTNGLTPTQATAKVVMTGLIFNGKLKIAEKMFEDFKKSGLEMEASVQKGLEESLQAAQARAAWNSKAQSAPRTPPPSPPPPSS